MDSRGRSDKRVKEFTTMFILIADGDDGIQTSLTRALNTHELIWCKSAEEALGKLEKSVVDVVISDNQMAKLSGLEFIERGKKMFPETSFLLMTASGTIPDAVKAMQMGADDYLTKPLDLRELRQKIQRIEERRTSNARTILKEKSGDTPIKHFTINPRGLVMTLENLEAKIIASAMEQVDSNQVQAAELLKISRATLQYKLKKYGIYSSLQTKKKAA
jgi:DNA-binding NtrC family response regulator